MQLCVVRGCALIHPYTETAHLQFWSYHIDCLCHSPAHSPRFIALHTLQLGVTSIAISRLGPCPSRIRLSHFPRSSKIQIQRRAPSIFLCRKLRQNILATLKACISTSGSCAPSIRVKESDYSPASFELPPHPFDAREFSIRLKVITRCRGRNTSIEYLKRIGTCHQRRTRTHSYPSLHARKRRAD